MSAIDTGVLSKPDPELASGVRQYIPGVGNPTLNASPPVASVNCELPSNGGEPPYLDRVGIWEYVKATDLQTQQKSVDFLKSNGIYTGAVGGCAVIAVAYGDGAITNGHYTHGALVHLAGSDMADVKWTEMAPKGGQDEVAQLVQKDPRNVAAVIFLDADRSLKQDYVDAVQANLGIPATRVTVYIGTSFGALSNAGLQRDGRFGITREPGLRKPRKKERGGCTVL